MKLKDEIMGLVESSIDRRMELFQDANRTLIKPEDLETLIKALPLLEDIKTEVSDIQRQVHKLKPKEEEPQNKEEPKTNDRNRDDPWEDPETRDLLERLDGLLDDYDKLREGLKRKSLPGPTSIGPTLDNLLQNFASGWYLWKSIIEDNIKKMWKTDDLSLIQNNIVRESDRITRQLEKLLKPLTSDTGWLRTKLNQIEEQMINCCQSLHDILGDVRRKVDILNPEGSVNQSLGIENRLRSIQGEIQSLRGLL